MGCTSMKQQQNLVFTQDEYIEHMLAFIHRNKQRLNAVIHQQFFKDFNQNLYTFVWPSDNKGALTRLLQDYIKIAVKATAIFQDDDVKKNQEFQNQLELFGKQFGREFKNILQQVQRKNKGVIQTLDFYPKIDQYKINFDVENPEQVKTLQNFTATLNEYAHQCQQAYFYLSLILVRTCLALQSQYSLPQINSRLKNTLDFINVDLIDTPQTDIANQLTFMYHGFRQDQYNIYSSNNIIKDQKQIYQTLSFQGIKNQDKQLFLQDKIMKFVQQAKNKYQQFQKLYYDACKDWNSNFKINYKLKHRQNIESLQRIKQKILFRQSYKDQQLKYLSIEQLLQKQKQRRKELIRKKLYESSSILLRISDILRGKCLFPTLQDVNKAVTKSIQKIQSQKRKGKDIQLVQIENRLKQITNDIVLKVRIGGIITQFQFAFCGKSLKSFKNQVYHMVYELVRSKTMSNISMLFAWHQKMAKRYIRFLGKVIKKNPPSSDSMQIYSNLMNNLCVNKQLDRQLKQPNSPWQKIPIKNDVITKLIENKQDQNKILKVRYGRNQRTADCYEQIQYYEKSLLFIEKTMKYVEDQKHKQKLNTKIQVLKQKINTKNQIKKQRQQRRSRGLSPNKNDRQNNKKNPQQQKQKNQNNGSAKKPTNNTNNSSNSNQKPSQSNNHQNTNKNQANQKKIVQHDGKLQTNSNQNKTQYNNHQKSTTGDSKINNKQAVHQRKNNQSNPNGSKTNNIQKTTAPKTPINPNRIKVTNNQKDTPNKQKTPIK